MESMKKFSMLTRGSILLLCAIALTFFGCSDKNEEPEVVKQLSASGALSFEAAGGSKTFAVTANIAWTVTGHESVAWLSISPAAGNGNETVTATATENTATTARSAELTITATGVTSVKVTITQAAAPEKPAEPVKISLAAIGGVTPPVAGATPVTAVTETAQYTGTVVWAPAAPTAFANSVLYTATITLTPKTGFTLTGVAQNFFTVAGATSATNPANSGVITARFPSTAAATPSFVAVTNITNVPTEATVGTPLMLSGTVVPSNATNKSIVWTLKSGPANLTGGSTLTPTATGTVVVTATITNGASTTTPYTKDFSIEVSASAPSFVAVTNITNVPTEATVGTPLTLSGTVAPSNATNKNIVWTLKSGPANLTGGSTLTPTATGTVVVTATITNGVSATTPYTKDFNINVTAAAAAPTLTVSRESISLGAGATSGAYQSFNITSNISWTLSSNQSWCTNTGNITSGNGNETVYIVVTANPSAAPRTAVITVSGGGITRTVTVTQAAAAPILTLSRESINLGAGATSAVYQTFGITSNTSWTLSSNQSWCTNLENITSGNGDKTIRVVVTANPSTAPRTAVITVSGGGITRTITVTQAAAVIPNISSASPLPAGKVGTPYYYGFNANGTSPLTWDIPDDPPPGLKMSDSGVLSGTPTKAGTFTFHVFVQNPAGISPEKQFTITIAP